MIQHLCFCIICCSIRMPWGYFVYVGNGAPFFAIFDSGLCSSLCLVCYIFDFFGFFAMQGSSKRSSGLAMHTGGFNSNWFKAIIVKEVIVFSAFCNLSLLWQPLW